MTLPELFFKKERTLNKEASYRLGNDTSSWEQDIVEKLHEEHPYLPDYDIKVNIRKIDERTGTGVGQITIDDNVRVPIIIKESKLMPLDLMYYNDKLLPMTKTSLENIMHTSSLGSTSKPVSSGTDMGLRAVTKAPYLGKYASALDYSAEELSDTMNASYEAEAFEYAIKTAAPFRRSLKRFIDGASIVKEAAARTPSITLIKEGNFSDITNGGVETTGGREGVMCQVISLDNSDTKRDMYLGTDQSFCRTESTPGIKSQVKLASSETKGLGVFYAEVNGTSVCTEPFQVRGKHASHISVTPVLGSRPVEIHQNSDFSGFKKIGNVVYLSDAWKFVPVNERISPPVKAVALNKFASHSHNVQLRKLNSFYEIKGDLSSCPGLQKCATSLPRAGTIYGALSQYCDKHTLREIHKIAEAGNVVKLMVQVPESVQTPLVGTPEITPSDRSALIKVAGIMTEGLIKEAGVTMEDADTTVDAVLGLNFLNQQNVYKMMESIDDLEVARAVLARMLMAGRLGLDVDVDVIRTATFALDAVIKDLRRVRHAYLADK